jgi:flagellar motor switch protein FliN/FliY
MNPQAHENPGANPTIAASPASADVMLDVGVTLSLEVGRTTMPIRQLLQLAAGSVVELDRPAGEQLDVLVNGRIVAHGEVVMVNDRYGVRFTEAVGKSDARR